MHTLIDPALSVGVVGYGHMGKVYVDVLQNVFAVSSLSVADPLLSASKSFKVCSSYTELAQCDVVIIAHPTELHAEAVEFFGNKAKALLIEKPLGLTYKESEGIVSILAQSRVTAMC